MILCFQCILQILKYSPLFLPINRKLLVKVLQSISSSKSTNVVELRKAVFQEFLQNFSGKDIDIECEIHLISVLQMIVEDNQSQLKSKLSQLAYRVLQVCSKMKNDEVLRIVQLYISFDRSPLDIIGNIINVLVSFNDDDVETYKSLSSNTFPYFYRAILEQLENHFIHSVSEIKDSKTRLKETYTVLSCLSTLVKLNINKDSTKVVTKQLNISLSFGRKILEKVDKSMTFFTEQFNNHKVLVLKIIKQIAPSTKVFHIVCNYAKETKDSTLAEKVPKVMSIMESLNYQVKELLDKNNCHGAFSIGNLIPRDIHGDIVQIDENEESGGEQEEEEEEDARSAEESVEW